MNLLYWTRAYGFFISIFVFLSFFPLFTVVASWIVLLIRTSPVVPHLHHYVTILPVRWHLFSSACLPLLGHVECPCWPSQCHRFPPFCVAMSELISHCYETCLVRCEETLVWKLWGQRTSIRSQLFMWTSCGDVTVTFITFIVTINRDSRTCVRI